MTDILNNSIHLCILCNLEQKVQSMVKERLGRYCKEVVSEANRDLTEKVIEKIANDKAGYMF